MTITRTRRTLATLTAECLIGTPWAVMGIVSPLACAGEHSLKFVGNLIRGAQNISLNRLDPTCPQCR